MRRFIIHFFILFFINCSGCKAGLYTQKPSKDFIGILENKNRNEFEKLRFDGAYHYVEKRDYRLKTQLKEGEKYGILDTPFLMCSFYFIPNGIVVYSGSYRDSINFIQTEIGTFTSKRAYINEWGGYYVHNDTITAIVYVNYMGQPFKGRTERLLSKFQGIIKNHDTICNWRMVPPYPVLPIFPNKDFLEELKTVRNLYFKKVPIQKLLEANNAWISERNPSRLYQK